MACCLLLDEPEGRHTATHRNQEPMIHPLDALGGPAVHITHAPSSFTHRFRFQRYRPSSYNTNRLYQSLHHPNRAPQYCWAYFWRRNSARDGGQQARRARFVFAGRQRTDDTTTNDKHTAGYAGGRGVLWDRPASTWAGVVFVLKPVRQPQSGTPRTQQQAAAVPKPDGCLISICMLLRLAEQ